MKRAKQEFAAEACACGSCRVIPGTGRRTVHFRDRNGHRKSLRLTVRFDRCESCGRSWHLPSHLSAIHESVVAAMGYLPPAELLQRRRLARLAEQFTALGLLAVLAQPIVVVAVAVRQVSMVAATVVLVAWCFAH